MKSVFILRFLFHSGRDSTVFYGMRMYDLISRDKKSSIQNISDRQNQKSEGSVASHAYVRRRGKETF